MNNIGTIEIGILCCILLYGMATLQTLLYYVRFKSKDSRSLRIIIAVIWLAELGHTVSVCWALYIVTILDFFQTVEELTFPPIIVVGILFGALIQPLVQAVFAARVYQFSNQWFIPAVCWCISANIFGSTALLSYKALVSPPLTKFEHHWAWLISSTLTATAIVDVLISASMCYHLQQHRSWAYRKTSFVLDKLILWTIQTGLITSITAIASAVFFMLYPDQHLWLAIFLVLTGMYSNTLLALLNGRWQLSSHYESTITTLNSLNGQVMIPLQHITFLHSPVTSSAQISPQSRGSDTTSQIALAMGTPPTLLPSPPLATARASSSRHTSLVSR